MKPNRVLILYKKSAYENYFLDRKSSLYQKEERFPKREIDNFKDSHLEHYRTLDVVEGALKELGLNYFKKPRGAKINYSHSDLIISVGGDGTFLEASRNLRTQMILGVNSDPKTSVGRYCTAHRETIQKAFKNILKDNFKIRNISRINLKLDLNNKDENIFVLNDILICHESPAAMSRYYLMINGIKEEQRSSGVWISTSSGSTGAIHSAGGKIMSLTDSRVQYKIRELYLHLKRSYRLKGGILDRGKALVVTSLMRNGVIFIDGDHLKFNFGFGCKAHISPSKIPLKAIYF